MAASRPFPAVVVILLSWLTWICLLFPNSNIRGFITTVDGAHSRRRVVRNVARKDRYDRSITTFDPNGRLLQVEYSIQAVSRGSPILCTLSLQDARLYIIVPQREHHQEQQLQVHRLDDHVFLFGTGIVGDTLFLSQNLRVWCQQHRLSYGEPPTVREVAEQAASLQHRVTRVGGVRPIGCTAAVVGVDPFVDPAIIINNPNNLSQEEKLKEESAHPKQHVLSGYVQLFRSGPGGVMEDCLYCAIGKDQDMIMKRMKKEYPAILRTENDSSSPSTSTATAVMKRLVRLMAQSTSSNTGGTSFFNTNNKNDRTYDVWTIEPSFGRRGNLQACCHCGVSSHK